MRFLFVCCSHYAVCAFCLAYFWCMPQWMSRCIAPWPHVSLRCMCAKMTFRLITGCVAWVPTQIHAFRRNVGSTPRPTGCETAMYGTNGQIAAAGIFHQVKRNTNKCNMERRTYIHTYINEFQATNAAFVEPIVGRRWLLWLKFANRIKKEKENREQDRGAHLNTVIKLLVGQCFSRLKHSSGSSTHWVFQGRSVHNLVEDRHWKTACWN